MFSDLSWLGIMLLIYGLAQLFYYAELRLEDTARHDILQKILIGICFVLWFISLPVTVVLGIVNFMHFRRLEDKITADCRADSSTHDHRKDSTIPIEIIAVVLLVVVIFSGIQNGQLKSEIESLESQIEEVEYECENQYENGYDDGYKEGYDNGYEVALSDPKLVSMCDACGVYYDPSSVFNFGFGLCDNCGRSTLSDCVFCGALTFDWGNSWYAVCPNCMGDVVELTDIEEFLENFNESR